MKMKNYISPLTEAITFAPEECVMEKQTLSGSGSMIETKAPARGPERRVNVMYI